MTSGLFNIGGTGESADITSTLAAVQPKFIGVMGRELTVDDFNHDLDLFGEFHDFDDPLGDTGMDSFVDLTTILTEDTFMDQAFEAAASLPFNSSDVEVQASCNTKETIAVRQTQEITAKHKPHSEKISCLDHDYIAKRPRMSSLSEETCIEDVEETQSPYQHPSPLPSSSSNETTSEIVEDKYRVRREKNNIASKRSREIRKRKFVDMEQEAERLEEENKRLEVRIVELEKLAKQMKEILVAKMAGK